jgi:flagellar basal body-associated protein FliL
MIRILSIALLVLMSFVPASFAQVPLRKANPHTPKLAPKPQVKPVVIQPIVTPQQQLLMNYQREQQRQYLNFQLQMQRQVYDQQLYLQWRRFWYGF